MDLAPPDHRDHDLVVFRITDRPVQDAFGLYRSEATDTGTCPGRPRLPAAARGPAAPAAAAPGFSQVPRQAIQPQMTATGQPVAVSHSVRPLKAAPNVQFGAVEAVMLSGEPPSISAGHAHTRFIRNGAA